MDSAILRLYTLREWIEDTLKSPLRSGELTFVDNIFANEMNNLASDTIKYYGETSYKIALKAGFYDFNNALSFYKEQSAAVKMHRDLVSRFVELQCLLMAVIAPHWAEGIWLEVLKKPHSIQLARFPEVPEVDAGLSAARKYISQTSSSVNATESLQMKKIAKGKDTSFDPKKPKKLTIYMSDKFPDWQSALVGLFQELWDPATKSVDDETLIGRIHKAQRKHAVPFVQALRKRLQSGETESAVLGRKLPFDEERVLILMINTLMRSAGLAQIQVLKVQEGESQGVDIITGDKVRNIPPVAASAVPGIPTFFFVNV